MSSKLFSLIEPSLCLEFLFYHLSLFQILFNFDIIITQLLFTKLKDWHHLDLGTDTNLSSFSFFFDLLEAESNRLNHDHAMFQSFIEILLLIANPFNIQKSSSRNHYRDFFTSFPNNHFCSQFSPWSRGKKLKALDIKLTYLLATFLSEKLTYFFAFVILIIIIPLDASHYNVFNFFTLVEQIVVTQIMQRL